MLLTRDILKAVRGWVDLLSCDKFFLARFHTADYNQDFSEGYVMAIDIDAGWLRRIVTLTRVEEIGSTPGGVEIVVNRDLEDIKELCNVR